MTVKFQNRTFKDVTKERPDVVQAVLSTSPIDVTIKIYEYDESRIIHSKNDFINRVSISNSKGNHCVKIWEIVYMLEQILKVNKNDVFMYVSQNGVIYLEVKDTEFVN